MKDKCDYLAPLRDTLMVYFELKEGRMRGDNLGKDRPKKEDRLKALGGLEPLGGDEVGVPVRVRVDKAYLASIKALSAKQRGQALAAWIEQKGVGNGKEG